MSCPWFDKLFVLFSFESS